MLRIKEKYRSCTVSIDSSVGNQLFDCTRDYPQDYLKRLSEMPSHAFLIEDVKKAEKAEKADEQQPVEKFPEFDIDQLEGMKLGELRKIYPFISSTSKASFIEELIELNFGNQ